MTLAEINTMKEELAQKQQEVAQLEKKIKQEELNREMNRIESLKMENFKIINDLRAKFSDENKHAAAIISELEKENEQLEAQWQSVYKVYFYL